MKEQKLGIGSVAAFNEEEYDYAIGGLKEYIIPHVNMLLDQFNQLGLDFAFDVNLLDSIVNTGHIQKIRDSYTKLLENRYAGYPVELRDMALTTIPQKLAPIEKTVKDIQNGIDTIMRRQMVYNYYFETNDLLIEGATCTVNEENVKSKVQIKIEADYQIELHNEFVAFEKQFNRLAALFEKNGEPVRNGQVILQYFIMQDNNRIKYNASTIKSFERRKKYAPGFS